MKLASLWIGDRLGPIEILSAQSFVAAGNDLTIFAYGPLADVPEGVEVRDAEPILSGKRILRYPHNGWPSIHSNLFRYAMLAQTEYMWCDLDVFALRRFDFSNRHVFGYAAEGRVNNAILSLPSDSPTLARLLVLSPETRGYPPDASYWDRGKLWLGSLGRGARLEHWGHGATGPRALTHFLRESGEIHLAQPTEVFYPVSWEDHAKLVAPDVLEPAEFEKGSYAIHLWGSHIRRVMKWRYRGEIPAKSLLGKLAARLGEARPTIRTPVKSGFKSP